MRHIEIIGGGPGGLYLALLLSASPRRWSIRVHETTLPADTFGFGVGFTGSTLRAFRRADADSHDAILAMGQGNPYLEFQLASGNARIRTKGNVGLERAALLRELWQRVERAGVDLEVGRSAGARDLSDADLIVGADGAGSRVRSEFQAELGATVEQGRGLYLWCGADVELPRTIFAVAQTEAGAFVTHAYPYAPGRSTFLVETDDATWSRSGLQAAATACRGGETDSVSLRYLETAFASVLGGASLIGNRTQWRRFRTVRTRHWHHENVVLLGDAAHTAHYSVGSGTKMAMEDAIHLADALNSEADVRAAFVRYAARRRPAVRRLQVIAGRSQEWWESFPSRLHLPVEQIALGFLTRTGHVRIPDIAQHDPEILEGAAAAVGADAATVDGILAAPLTVGSRRLPHRLLGPGWSGIDPHFTGNGSSPGIRVAAPAARDVKAPWGPAGDAVVGDADRLLKEGADVLRLVGVDGTRASLLRRLDMAERFRLQLGARVAVDADPGQLPDVAGAIAAGKSDLVTRTGMVLDDNVENLS
jgi:anthraniloyl-CoA monooxygenase